MPETDVSRLLHHTFSISDTRALGTAWRELLNSLFDPYRPELHYMRGPGPKWRAKHLVPTNR
jgi:hypothetical protein